ncbi:MAG TPA: CotH kinase family protein, partial [Candidatus Saccharimonadales bacterium]|nr:CotH kinase family protein [Candidatus Saccharimonadales bacterium]
LELHHFSSNETRHASIYKAIDHAANFSQPGHDGYEQREPDPLMGQFWEPLDSLNRFVSTSSDADFFDPAEGITKLMDLDNAIDFHLLVLVTSNGDGITKNFILARDVRIGKSPEPKFFFVPWDYDATFGRNWNATVVPPDAWLSNHLFERLYGHVEYQKKYQARWRELRKKQFSLQTIQGAIDDNAKTLGEAIHRNNRQWRSAAGHYPDKLTFEEDVTAMKQWVAQRLEWLDKKFGL